MWRFAFVVIAACGRIGFDPGGINGGDNAAVDDASTMNGDGNTTDPDGPPPVDAFAAVCAGAITVGVGRTATLDTCTTKNNIDACSAGKEEIVFKFIPPTTRGYTIRAFDGATQNTSNSTARMDGSCLQRMGGCAGVLGTGLTAGQPYYFVVEASAGACAQIQFSIQ